MSGNGQQPGPSPRIDRLFRATLPIGLCLLALWAASMVAAVTIGGEIFGMTLFSALLGLGSCLCLILSGAFYRRLDRRRREGR